MPPKATIASKPEPESFLRFNDLKARRIVRNRTTLSRWIRDYGFPPPVELGPNSAGYPESQVEAWLRNRPMRSLKRAAPKPQDQPPA